MNNRNVQRAAVDSKSSPRFPLFDLVIWALTLGLLLLLVAVTGCGVNANALAGAKTTRSFSPFSAGDFRASGHTRSDSW